MDIRAGGPHPPGRGVPLSALRSLDPAEALRRLPGMLASFVGPADAREAARAGMEAVLAGVQPEAFAGVLARMEDLGADFGLQAEEPLAGRLTEAFLEPLILPSSAVEGLDELAGAPRTMIVANHLSYVDTVALRQLLRRAGVPLGDRLCAVAGPKVYREPLRLFAVAAHRSIRVPQSSQLDGRAEELSPRELVRAIKGCLEAAEAALDAGLAVVLFPEGTRSRSGRMQPFFRGVARWVSLPGLVLQPLALEGTDRLYGLRDVGLAPATLRARFGPPLAVDALAEAGLDRVGILEAAHAAVAALLPEGRRPEPGAPALR